MVISMMANGNIRKGMGKEFLLLKMEINMRAHGKKIKSMEKEFLKSFYRMGIITHIFIINI